MINYSNRSRKHEALKRHIMPKILEAFNSGLDDIEDEETREMLKNISCDEAVYILESTIEKVKTLPLNFSAK